MECFEPFESLHEVQPHRAVSERGGLWTHRERLEVLDSTAVCRDLPTRLSALVHTLWPARGFAGSYRPAPQDGPVRVRRVEEARGHERPGGKSCSREPGRVLPWRR